MALRECCNEICKCAGHEGVQGPQGPPGTKVLHLPIIYNQILFMHFKIVLFVNTRSKVTSSILVVIR